MPEQTDKERSTTLIDVDGRHVAALLHDSSLREEQELLDAVSAAAGIALENARLQAELRASFCSPPTGLPQGYAV